MLRITVPATSANLGAGFDSLGAALCHYNQVEMELSDRVDIQSMDGTVIPTDETNLIYQTAAGLFAEQGKKLPGLTIRQWNNIPIARGLGSSSACIVAGLLGANTLLGTPYTRDELVDRAARLEGHPDNSTPAFVGGIVTAALEEGKVWYVRQQPREDLVFVAVIPDFELQTAAARAAIPKEIPHKDGVYNLSRAALMALSLGSGQYQNLRIAAQDRLHQPYRLGLIPGAEELFRWADELGAHAAFISGAGSTLMALVDSEHAPALVEVLRGRLDAARKTGWRILPLLGDAQGAVVAEF